MACVCHMEFMSRLTRSSWASVCRLLGPYLRAADCGYREYVYVMIDICYC